MALLAICKLTDGSVQAGMVYTYIPIAHVSFPYKTMDITRVYVYTVNFSFS